MAKVRLISDFFKWLGDFKGWWEMFYHIFLLLFRPDGLVKVSVQRDIDVDKDKIRDAVFELRKKVFRALRIAIGITLLSLGVSAGLSRLVYHAVSFKPQCFGYFMIAWGLLSPASHLIYGVDKATLPEIVNEEFHRLIYSIGIIILLISYFWE